VSHHKLTPAFIRKARVEPGATRSIYWDTSLRRFGLLVMASGHKSFVVQYRHRRSSRRLTLNSALSLADARKEAQAVLGRVAKGEDVVEERRKEQRRAVNSFEQIAREYLERNRSLLSITKYGGVLERLIFPKLGSWQIEEIKRSDIARLVDKVTEEQGPGAARSCLAVTRRVLNYHAGRADDFRPPVLSELARDLKATKRARILNDDELRAIWKAAGASAGPFGALVRFLLLTGARRNEALHMRWSELNGGGSDWVLPAARNKIKVDLVRPLSGAAMSVLDGLPRIGDAIFTLNGERAIGGLSDLKRQLDEASGVRGWTLHDLRRTARSLMSRAEVPREHSEQCLGHVIRGTEGTYDRHDYYKEKQRAYDRLSALIGRIVGEQPTDNVVPMRGELSA
jgi:integrase